MWNKFLKLPLAIIAVVLLSGCGINQSATISKIMLAGSEAGKAVKASEQPNGFGEKIDKIVFAGELTGGGTHNISVDWVKSDAKKPLKTEAKKIKAGSKFAFELPRPVAGWVSGDYSVDVKMDDKEVGKKTFKIAVTNRRSAKQIFVIKILEIGQ